MLHGWNGLQVERREQAADLLKEFEGLWDVLDMAPDVMERQKFEVLLTGTACVHASTFEQVAYHS